MSLLSRVTRSPIKGGIVVETPEPKPKEPDDESESERPPEDEPCE